MNKALYGALDRTDRSLVAAVVMAELRCSYGEYCCTPRSVIEYLLHLIPQRRALTSEPRWES